jgi:hypothetical protein
MAIEDVLYNVDGSIAGYRFTDGRFRPYQPRAQRQETEKTEEVPVGSSSKRQETTARRLRLLVWFKKAKASLSKKFQKLLYL